LLGYGCMGRELPNDSRCRCPVVGAEATQIDVERSQFRQVG
jgi:hypothetical protein